MMDDDLIPKLMTHYAFDFTTICVAEDFLVPTTFSIRIDMFPSEDSDVEDIELGLNKVAYWIDLVSKSVIACVSNSASVAMLIDAETHAPRISNQIMLLPYDPDEETMAKVIQSKFNALGGGHVSFGVVDISADHGHGVGFTYMGDGEAELPKMDEWVGTKNWFDEPWWARDDASMIDTAPPADTDFSKTPSWAYSLDFLGEKPPKPDSVVVVAGNFKPKVIDGGGEKPK